MNIRLMTLAACMAGALGLASSSAHANLLTNGDFETGDFTGWSQFTTSNGVLDDAAVVSFDTNGDSSASNAASFRAGAVQGTSAPGLQGGGLFQIFASGSGILDISLDIAASFFNTAGVNGAPVSNLAGGRFELFLDGVSLDVFDFGQIDGNAIERASLSGSTSVLGGPHEIRIQVTRGYHTFGFSPTQYIDDVVVTLNAGQIAAPEPAAVGLLGLGALAAVRLRRRRGND